MKRPRAVWTVGPPPGLGWKVFRYPVFRGAFRAALAAARSEGGYLRLDRDRNGEKPR